MVATTPAPGQDPSLEALVPRPSPWRNAALAVTALVVLVTVGVVGVQSRISVVDSGGGAEAAPGHIFEEHHVVATGWPGLTATSAAAQPGARLVGAWLVPASARIGGPGDSVKALVDALEADGAQYRLPHAITPGLEYRLVLASEIVSCSTLAANDQGLRQYTGADPAAPTVHLRTSLGAQADAAVTSIGWDRDTLDTYASCPD